jgi:molecular chaperone GrpE
MIMKKDKDHGKNTAQDSMVEDEIKQKEGDHKKEDAARDDSEKKEDAEVDLEQELQEEIEGVDKIKGELEEIKGKYLRLYSEFDNFRKRSARERLELIKTANEELMTVLLPVLDDFERAQKAVDKNGAPAAIEGYEHIYKKLLKLLGQQGLKSMDISKGSEFTPEFHEAIAQIPAKEELKGKVVDVIEQGYYLGEKVIRYAKVVIGA